MSTNPQWYMAVGGHQVGPVSEDEIVSNIKNGSADGSTLVFTAGMDNWMALKDVDRLPRPSPDERARGGPSPPMPGRRAHEIDFNIVGEDLQFVEVELDPGESVVAEAGGMMYMTQGIEMETVFGDGSSPRRSRAGSWEPSWARASGCSPARACS